VHTLHELCITTSLDHLCTQWRRRKSIGLSSGAISFGRLLSFSRASRFIRRLRLLRSALWHRQSAGRKSENRESLPVAEFSSKRSFLGAGQLEPSCRCAVRSNSNRLYLPSGSRRCAESRLRDRRRERAHASRTPNRVRIGSCGRLAPSGFVFDRRKDRDVRFSAYQRKLLRRREHTALLALTTFHGRRRSGDAEAACFRIFLVRRRKILGV